MLQTEASNKIPENPSKKKQPEEATENVAKNENLFSPRFRSVAAMAGWDEEALLIASLIVEDTPERQSKQKKRSDLQNFITPPTNSRRKRRAQRRSPMSIPITVLDLDEDEPKTKQETEKINTEAIVIVEVEKKKGEDEVKTKGSGVNSTSGPVIPCIDKLREELSCAICLEICYEPSTTPCGHSFCKKCLRSSADKCGKKCPKCRQLISNGKYCTINTVLWNTIQLLFPQEVEARKAAASASSSDSNEQPQRQSPARTRHQNTRNRTIQVNSTESTIPARTRHQQNTRNRIVEALNSPESVGPDRRTQRSRNRISRPSRVLPSQDEDAALALRLQREEFMGAFRAPDEQRNSIAVARANLRAMASRAINIRIRDRTD